MSPMITDFTAAPRMSQGEFARLGLEDIAYVKPTEVDGATAYAIHTADGNAVAVVADRDLAFATVRQNDLQPLSVH